MTLRPRPFRFPVISLHFPYHIEVTGSFQIEGGKDFKTKEGKIYFEVGLSLFKFLHCTFQSQFFSAAYARGNDQTLTVLAQEATITPKPVRIYCNPHHCSSDSKHAHVHL